MDKRKSFSTLMAPERAKGIFSLILYYVFLSVVGQIVVVFSLKTFRNITGIFDEELFNNLVTWLRLIILMAVFIIIYFKTLKEDIKRLTRKNGYFIIVAAIIVLILNYGSNAVLELFSISEAANKAPVMSLLTANAVFALIMTTICGPVIEELVFRRALNQIVNNKIIFVTISALLFGLVHETNIRIIPYLIMGAICAVTYLKTNKNVISSITIHFINNLVAILLWMFFK